MIETIEDNFEERNRALLYFAPQNRRLAVPSLTFCWQQNVRFWALVTQVTTMRYMSSAYDGMCYHMEEKALFSPFVVVALMTRHII